MYDLTKELNNYDNAINWYYDCFLSYRMDRSHLIMKIDLCNKFIDDTKIDLMLLMKGKYKIWYEDYKKIKGLMQITIGSKGNTKKILTNFFNVSNSEYEFKIYNGSRLLLTTNSIKEAIQNAL